MSAALSSLNTDLIALEQAAEAMQSKMNRQKAIISSRNTRIEALERSQAQRTEVLFQQFYLKPNRSLSLSSFGHIPLLQSFILLGPKDHINIARVNRQWRALSSEIRVQEEVWVTYAQRHYPDIYRKNIPYQNGKSLIFSFVKQRIMQKTTESKLDRIDDELEIASTVQKTVLVLAGTAGYVGLVNLYAIYNS